jgi:hypothetical protein
LVHVRADTLKFLGEADLFPLRDGACHASDASCCDDRSAGFAPHQRERRYLRRAHEEWLDLAEVIGVVLGREKVPSCPGIHILLEHTDRVPVSVVIAVSMRA